MLSQIIANLPIGQKLRAGFAALCLVMAAVSAVTAYNAHLVDVSVDNITAAIDGEQKRLLAGELRLLDEEAHTMKTVAWGGLGVAILMALVISGLTARGIVPPLRAVTLGDAHIWFASVETRLTARHQP